MHAKIFKNKSQLLKFGTKKIHGLGRRNKWQDYVDLYYVFQQHSLEDVIKQARKLFGTEINERMVREQLNYFADVDYSQIIEYLPGQAVSDETVKETLKKIAVS